MDYTASIFQRLQASGCTMDNHESDLYVKLDGIARGILQTWCAESGHNHYKQFRSEVDGAMWAELPFRFDPYWENRQAHV